MANSFCELSLRVTPRSSQNRLEGSIEALKAWVNAPPVDGAANEAVILLRSKRLGVAPSLVALVRGESSRTKTFRIEGMTLQAAAERLASR